MNFRRQPPISPMNHLRRARAHVSRTAQCCLSSVRSNRHHHAVVHALILLLRFGQVVTAAILGLVFGYLVFEHLTHWCQWYPEDWMCENKRNWEEDPRKVPWSYGVVIATVSLEYLFIRRGPPERP